MAGLLYHRETWLKISVVWKAEASIPHELHWQVAPQHHSSLTFSLPFAVPLQTPGSSESQWSCVQSYEIQLAPLTEK